MGAALNFLKPAKRTLPGFGLSAGFTLSSISAESQKLVPLIMRLHQGPGSLGFDEALRAAISTPRVLASLRLSFSAWWWFLAAAD